MTIIIPSRNTSKVLASVFFMAFFVSFASLSKNPTAVTLTRGPYLQMLGTTSIVIRWQTNTASDTKVDFGTTLVYSNQLNNSTLVTEHEIKLSGLATNTKYYYRIGTSALVLQGDNMNYFKTAPTLGTSDFSAWVIGDMGTGSAGQLAVKSSFQNYALTNPISFWLWLGDNAYNTGTAANYTSNVFNIYPEIFKNLPVFPAVGNHDYGDIGYQTTSTLTTSFEYFNAFTMPTNAELGGVVSGSEKYYSYNYGNAHFVVIDSYGALNNVGSAMYNWLQRDLTANTQKWTVCYFHHPPYSKGTHNSDTDAESINVRNNLNPLFETYNVDLVLSGHSHVYERSFPLKGHFGVENTLSPTMVLDNSLGNSFPWYRKSLTAGLGTIYAVCGTSGQGGVVATVSGYPHDAMAKSYNDTYGSMILNFKSDTLTAKYLASDGTIKDNFKIVKRACDAASLYESKGNGNWATTQTWACGQVPPASSIVIINKNHTVSLNANYQTNQKMWIQGTLNLQNNVSLIFGN